MNRELTPVNKKYYSFQVLIIDIHV